MLNLNKVSKVFFSPSGTTEKIVNRIASNFESDYENYDLSSFDESKEFGDELVIIGIPAFDGHIPDLAKRRLKNMKGNNTKAIAIINYGNISYGDALVELTDLLKENNFDLVAVGTTVSQHSIFNQIAKNRPDKYDFIKIDNFAKQAIEKLRSGKENEIVINSSRPYPDYQSDNYLVSCNEDQCIECMDCYYTCPEDAIPENPYLTDLSDCTRCGTCISICPEDARSYNGIAYELEKQDAVNEFSIRNDSEFYM